jgi:phosphoribosylaminoimidazole-succinocarboxamide synthase
MARGVIRCLAKVHSASYDANVFKLLSAAGIPTHFVVAPSDDEMVVRRCDMIPLEVVMRRIATALTSSATP